MNYTYLTPTEAGYNLTNGLDNYFSWIARVQPTFFIYFTIMLWAVIFAGGSYTEKKLTNRDQYTKWGFLASFITFGISLVLSLQFSNLIYSASVVMTTLALTILFGVIWYIAK